MRRVAGSRLRYRAPLDDEATGEGAEGDTCLERGGTEISAVVR